MKSHVLNQPSFPSIVTPLPHCIHIKIIPTPNHDHDHQVRNLSRSLLVERLGGLAVSGELNVPALPSLAIVQVPVHVLGEQVVDHCSCSW